MRKASAEGAAPPPGRRKLLIIVGGVVVPALVAGAGLYFTGMIDRLIGHRPRKSPRRAPAPKPLVFFDLPDFLVNLNTTGPRSRAS